VADFFSAILLHCKYNDIKPGLIIYFVISVVRAGQSRRGGGGPQVENLCACFRNLLRVYSQWGLERTKSTPAGRKTARMEISKGVKSENIFSIFFCAIPNIYI
jgi:hypothetical protein